MLKDAIQTKRCIMVCGGGGVGKTTMAASVAIAAAKVRKRVLVVTIDPAKRLMQAFGFENAFTEEGGEPLPLSLDIKTRLGLPTDSNLSVAVLNPKYVLNQILDQTINPDQKARLQRTKLYAEMSQMIYGLQEYTAYEWVTRMINNNEYDLIVLDTPPAFHAKDFFSAPDKIRNLMESRVFHMFLPKKKNWLGEMLSFGWLEKLLGSSVFGESRMFFEIFTLLRDRILDRCNLLAKFFLNDQVAVVAVATVESSAQLEIEGLLKFLDSRKIPVQTLIVNQLEILGKAAPSFNENGLTPGLKAKLDLIREHQGSRANLAQNRLNSIRAKFQGEVIPVGMNYSSDGFDVLKENAYQLLS